MADRDRMTDKDRMTADKFSAAWADIWRAIESDASAKGQPFRKSSFREACEAGGHLLPYPYQPAEEPTKKPERGVPASAMSV